MSLTRHQRIHALVRAIPTGRVSTYGWVARAAGLARHARQVGYALAALPDGSDVPWHRVVNARGEIARRTSGHLSERIQRALLEAEGVVFSASGRIDLERYGWVSDESGSA